MALLALATVFGAKLKGAWGGPRPAQTAIQATLVRWPQGAPPHRTAPTPGPTPPPPLTVAQVDALSEAAVEIPLVDPPPPDPAAADATGDVDGLYRAPFRDAVGQAYASLRGGLGCAHVDLDALPAPVRALCEAAMKPPPGAA